MKRSFSYVAGLLHTSSVAANSYDNYVYCFIKAFTTLHMMYHEATACHVTGDLTEVLMILHNLLVCCRPHSNKPGIDYYSFRPFIYEGALY